MSITDLNLANVTKVEGGYGHSLALTSDGKLYSWGLNDEGQLGQGNTTNLTTPTQVGTDTDWVDIGCGEKHSIALKSGLTSGFYAWGRNTHGQCGSAASTYISSPAQVYSGNTYTAVDAGANYSILLDATGAIFGCGLNEHKCLTSAVTTNNVSLTNLYSLTGFSLIAAGPQFTAGFIPGTGIYVRGRHSLSTSYYSNNFATNTTHYYSLFDQSNSSLVPNSENLDIIALDIGRDFLLAIDQSGKLYGYTSSNTLSSFTTSSGWDPAEGVLDGTYDCSLGHFGIFYNNYSTTNYVIKTNYAEMIDQTKEWHKVECGFDHAILTDIDGDIYSIGDNGYTQLGRTFTGNDTNIVQMEGTAATGNWTVIGCGHYHSLLCKGS